MDIIRLANIFYGLIKKGEKNVGKYIEQRFYQEFGYDVYPPDLRKIDNENGEERWGTKEEESPSVIVINKNIGKDISDDGLIFYINGKEIGGGDFYRAYKKKVNGEEEREEVTEEKIVYTMFGGSDYYTEFYDEEAIDKLMDLMKRSESVSVLADIDFENRSSLNILKRPGLAMRYVFKLKRNNKEVEVKDDEMAILDEIMKESDQKAGVTSYKVIKWLRRQLTSEQYG